MKIVADTECFNIISETQIAIKWGLERSLQQQSKKEENQGWLTKKTCKLMKIYLVGHLVHQIHNSMKALSKPQRFQIWRTSF
jgi:hypothetical protein